MRKLKKYGSAQIFILVALAIASIIVSTEVYVFQLRQVSSAGNPFSPQDFVRNVKLSSRNLMTGLLANISHGGGSETLETSLERWASFVENNYYFGEGSLRFDLCGTSPYSSGLWMSWGQNGLGVTSAKADFSMNLTSEDTELTVTFPMNVTTSLSTNGVYAAYPPFWHEVNVSILLNNEGEPALVENLTIYYQYKSSWREAALLSSFDLKDLGNGTYSASFVVSRFSSSHRISVNSYDRREILVRANATCSRIIPDFPIFLVGTKRPELSMFDNKTWTSITPPPTMSGVDSMGSNAVYWLIGCSNKRVWKYDGQSFTDVSPSSPNNFNQKITAIGYGNGYWLVGDDSGIIKKFDGGSWTDLTNDAGFLSQNSPIDEIEWNEDFGYWLVGGKKIVKKFDGTTWSDISPASRKFEDEIGGIGCDGSIWLLGDLKGVVQEFDGTTWTDLTSDAGFYTDSAVYAIDWGNDQFLVGGKNGKVKIFDGSSWSDKSSGWGSSDHVYAVEWSDTYSYWLVGGRNGIIKSFDGSSWTDRTGDAGFADDVRAISIEFQC